MQEEKFFVRFKTEDEGLIRKIVSDAGANIDFVSEVHPNVAVINISIDKENEVLDRLKNNSAVESIFGDIQYQTF